MEIHVPFASALVWKSVSLLFCLNGIPPLPWTVLGVHLATDHIFALPTLFDVAFSLHLVVEFLLPVFRSLFVLFIQM